MTPLPQLIPLTDLDLSVRPAGLVELAAGELGNAAGPGDGFDAAFNDIAVFLGTGEGVAAAFDTEFAELAGAGPLPDPATLDADVLAFAADKVTGDAILSDFSTLLGPAPPPPTPVVPAPVTPTALPPPPPVPIGGGGGGPAPELPTPELVPIELDTLFPDFVFLGGGGGGAGGGRIL